MSDAAGRVYPDPEAGPPSGGSAAAPSRRSPFAFFKSGAEVGPRSTSSGGRISLVALYGSVVPRCLPWAFLGCAFGASMKASGWDALDYHNTWHHPYSLHVFGMVLGFTLVMRIQIAYQRYWEGATQCHQASAKWGDGIMQIMAFDEASKDAWSDEAFEFRLQMLHFCSLMHALALIDIRQDEELSQAATLNLNMEDPYLFRPGKRTLKAVGPAQYYAKRQDSRPATPAPDEHAGNDIPVLPGS